MRAVEAPPLVVHANGICTAKCEHQEPSAAEVVVCRIWLRRWAQPRKSINAATDSYVLKHAVERSTEKAGMRYPQVDRWGREWTGHYWYVSNGAFIKAALLEGYRCVPTGLNAMFNISIRRVPVSVVQTPDDGERAA